MSQQFFFGAASRSSDDNHRDGLRVADVGRAQQFQYLKAIYFRHLQVCNQQVVVLCPHGFHEVACISAHITTDTVMGIHIHCHRKKNVVVIQHNDRIGTFRIRILFLHFFLFDDSNISGLHGYFYRETTAPTFLAFQSDSTA